MSLDLCWVYYLGRLFGGGYGDFGVVLWFVVGLVWFYLVYEGIRFWFGWICVYIDLGCFLILVRSGWVENSCWLVLC